ncbi:FecCD family ABC transporter permease [Desulfurobacterium atlanticum]|uniref:Iron complex transport system permease protein n=1 Tax=Desulfurobacterium atlanticum TaxID=240169 RepID=A0A238YB16_9BACT|nr:iron ABC transporter permease [Desulfurobacterium atlanticum]SNR68317.1 iron complex transport system permease protein [Desulfurobacterium atlanticum]
MRKIVSGIFITSLLAAFYILYGSPSEEIIKNIRIPEALLTLSAGSILAVSGVIYQNVLSNPLADPYILGISAGSGLGAVIAFLTDKNPSSFAMIGGILIISIITFAAKILNSKVKLILFGVGINALLSALIVFLSAVGSNEKLPSVLFFLMGFIPITSLKTAFLLFLSSTLLLFILIPFSKKADALSLGDSFAYFAGLTPEKERVILITITSFFVALTISFTGIIGFIGIVIPHIGRFLKILRTKPLLIFSFFTGGNALLIAKAILKFLFPTLEVPVGVIVSLAGAPLFITILVRSNRLA